MRIAIVTNNSFPPREGVARHIQEIGRRLKARGHEILVLARGGSFRGWQELESGGLKVRCFPWLPIRPFHQAAMRPALDRWLADGADGAELLHLHLPLLPDLGGSLPRVVTFHSPMVSDTDAINEPGLKPLLIKLNARLFSKGYEERHIAQARDVIAVSANVAAELKAAYPMHGHEPRIIHNGVDTRFFQPFARNERTRALLYVGRLSYRKGLFRLLDALALMEDRSLELHLVGEGPLKADLEAHAAGLGIAGQVRFRGFLSRPRLRAALHAAACYINPADYESGPLTLLEAMACGTPVVSTATGLVPELGATPPLLLARQDAGDLARCIEHVLSDPAAAAARAVEARLLVERRFDWSRIVDQLEEVYTGKLRQAA